MELAGKVCPGLRDPRVDKEATLTKESEREAPSSARTTRDRHETPGMRTAGPANPLRSEGAEMRAAPSRSLSARSLVG